MHWVDRGPEPVGLPEVRERYTPGWVCYYRDRHGDRPTDSHWRRFAGVLQQRFDDLCAYCEGTRRGVVDHFRPKSRFPEVVYEWSNWLFACHACNHAKGWKWPPGGYVDPCAASKQARPESYFIFDTLTGEILPKEDLTPRRRRKALKIINDLQLNARQLLRDRIEWLHAVSWLSLLDRRKTRVTMRLFADSSHPAPPSGRASHAPLCPNAGIGSTTDTSVLTLFPHRLALGLLSCLC